TKPGGGVPSGRSRFPAGLGQHIESGRSVDTSEPLDPETGLPSVFDPDPLYEWALGAWRFLRERRYDEVARDFKGGDDRVSFERAFKAETAELGREGYRNRCVRILEEAFSGWAEGVPVAPVTGNLRLEAL